MIHNSLTQPVMISSGARPLRFQGTGKVSVSPHNDVIILETESARYTVQVPGHTFGDGEEVDFEVAGETVYLSKKTERISGLAVHVLPKDELILQDDSDADLLIATLKSLIAGLDSHKKTSTLPVDLLKQLSVAMKGVIDQGQQEQLDRIIEIICKKGNLNAPDVVMRIRSLIAEFGTELSNRALPLTSMTRLFTFPELMISEGIFQFQDLASVLNFLGNPENTGWEKYLKDLLDSDGLLWMRIADTGNKFPGAFLIAPSALKNEMISMISSVSTDILKQFPIETFMKFISNNGGIDKNLINLLANRMSSVSDNYAPLMSSKLSSGTCLQWLHTLNELRDYSDVLSNRQPVRSTDLFRGLLEIKETYGVLQRVSLNEIGIIPGSGKNAMSLIENTFNNIGFSTECKLSKGLLPPASLKIELYRLLDSTQSTEQDPRTARGIIDKTEKRGVLDIFQMVHTVQSFLRQEVSRLRNGFLPQNELLLRNLLQTETLIDQLIHVSNGSQDNSVLSKVSSEMREQLSVLVSSIETLDQPEVSAVVPSIQNLKRISSFMEMLRQICSTIPSLNSLSIEFENLVIELKKNVNHILGGFDVSSAQGMVDLQNKSVESEQLVELTRQADLNAVESTINLPRKIVEQLINKVESLQILARQVTTPDGATQILELPVKIGNEWTDVTLQIVKKEGRKNGRSTAQQHYSIYLDTAPSRLGGIHAVLDYEKGKSLSITMDFENKEVASWFNRKQENIRKSLQESNIHFVNIHFKTREVSTRNTSSENTPDLSRNFDVKA